MKYAIFAILSTLVSFAILNPELVRNTLSSDSVQLASTSSTEPPQEPSPQTKAKPTSRPAKKSRKKRNSDEYTGSYFWLKGSAQQRARLSGIEGRTAPGLFATRESSPPELHRSMLRNKVVVVCFWSTWCGPCLEAIEHNNDIYRRFKNKGVVFIGMCNPKGSEKMKSVAKEYGIKYPIAIDDKKKTIKAYKVRAYPAYYVIDRSGKLRYADCKKWSVPDAVEFLLNERR